MALKLNTAMDTTPTDRADIKHHTPIRARLADLRIKLVGLEDSAQADSPKGRELRAQIAILTELVEEAC